MRFRTAFPVALFLGGSIGGTLAAGGIDPHPARAGEPVGLISEAAAATAARWDIPVVRNDAVEHFVGLFTGRHSDAMADYLKRSGRYEGMIRQKLRKAGMPEDLVYLSMIESGFNPNARSRVNAVGLWQFMAPTARGYGLRVDGYVDERRDPEKSTDAALRYLRDLHDQLGSWYLAAAAYNGGDGRVSRALKAETGFARGRSDADFWRIRHRLPRETREYVPLMVAAALVGKEPEKYGLGDVARWMPVETDTVSVPGGIDLGVVATAAGVSEREVTRLNSHLVRKMTPPGKKDFPVSIPEGSRERFDAAFPALRAEAVAAAEARAVREAEVARERAAELRAAERRASARRAEARRHHVSASRAHRPRYQSSRQIAAAQIRATARARAAIRARAAERAAERRRIARARARRHSR